jgi:hypothetical protein
MGINEGMRLLRVICLLPLLGLNSCTYLLGKAAKMGMFDKKLPKNNRTGEAKLIGTIELVNPEQNYVLINCEQRLNIPAGTEIVSQNADGTKAKLKVTPERKGNYITADIKEGLPQVRDLVLYQIKPGDLPPPTTSPTGTIEGPAVSLTPVMQADVIPPLDVPFQPMAPLKTPLSPPPLPLQPVQPQTPAPVTPKVKEPVFDPGGLPPAIR